MNTRRILGTVIVLCVLFAVCGADQADMDAFQTKRQVEDTAAKPVPEDDGSVEAAELAEADEESGQDAEQAVAGVESVQGMEQAEADVESGQDIEQKEALKQNILLEAGAQESDILLFDYDDYDGDGNYEAFMLVGNRLDSEYEWVSGGVYDGKLYFASADCCKLVRDNDYGYRMIDGKMEFSGGRKYLFFDTDQYATANISELWTVRDGEPVEESGLLQMGEVSYYGGDEFEVWVDAYDLEHDIDVELDLDIWLGHTWKPYFYHYHAESDRLEAYGGEIISKEAFTELSGTNIIEEIEAREYTVGEIIHWENDIVTINYHYDMCESSFYYENVIWDNHVKDFWRRDERGVTSWEDAGVGGSYLCGSMRK